MRGLFVVQWETVVKIPGTEQVAIGGCGGGNYEPTSASSDFMLTKFGCGAAGHGWWVRCDQPSPHPHTHGTQFFLSVTNQGGLAETFFIANL